MNAANQANFDELQGHIRITKAKMAKAGEAEESLADDLEAYYERQLQLRVMRNNDLTIELEEAQQRMASLSNRLWQICAVVVVGLVLAGVTAAVVFFPSALVTLLVSDTAQWVAALVATATAASAFTCYAVRRPTRTKVN